MVITVEALAHPNYGRWPTQQPSPEYAMLEYSGLFEYEARPTNPAAFQRTNMTPDFMVNGSYTMAPTASMAPNTFGFDTYVPPSPNTMALPFRQHQDGLPALRSSPPEDRRTGTPVYPRQQLQSCTETQGHSPSVKSEPLISSPASLAPDTPAASKTILPNVDDHGSNKIVFNTEVDILMRAIQQKVGDEEPAVGRGESNYPSPPHQDDASFDSDSKSSTLENKPHSHENRHLNIRAFKCTVCNKAFHQKANLRIHEDIHSGIKRFECKLDGCPKKFGTRGNLKNHMNRFHKQSIAEWEEKFNQKEESEFTPAEREMCAYFYGIFKNCNKGIKGRGMGRRVQRLDEMMKSMGLPMHHPLPQSTVVPAPAGGFLPYGTPRGDPGNGRVNCRDTRGTYEMYGMDQDSIDGSNAGSSPTGVIHADDRHRGLGFQDRFHERIY
ncbi:hypothetical protein DL769_008385 [Monosporascus sp. CRB-8-3]|nr:hypothetical protein DL769_008385 [Monosporascus sp. CRB-8-3]